MNARSGGGVVAGAVAGGMATVATSAVMLLAGRLNLMGKQPPERIVERAADAAGIRTDETQKNVAASAAHFAFGAAAGAGYGLLQRRLAPVVPELVALPWALAVWAASYLGWVPALGIMPPAFRDRPSRAWTMVLAHVVFGLSLGAVWRLMRRSEMAR